MIPTRSFDVLFVFSTVFFVIDSLKGNKCVIFDYLLTYPRTLKRKTGLENVLES